MPTSVSSPLTEVPSRSFNSSVSSSTSRGGAENEFRIEMPRPALLPGV